jgi:uncharacterized OsmC-like protein
MAAMKITLHGDDAIRLEPTPGTLTIEAPTADVGYSPFHMLASALASCTFSVLQSWATHKKLSVDDLVLDVQWKFTDDPHRVSDLDVSFTWPSLPADRNATAKRVAALCTVHATLMHPPAVGIRASSEPVTAVSPTTAASEPKSSEPEPATSAAAPSTPSAAASAPPAPDMHGDPAAAPEVTASTPAAT